MVVVQCPRYQSTAVVKYGKQPNGTQRYRCQNPDCARRIFLLAYQDRGRLPEVKRQIVDLTLHGNGVRDIARVLGASSATVIATLRGYARAVR
jgi:transposase-like protein